MAKLSDLQKLLKGLDDKIEHLQATKRLILEIDADKRVTAKPKRTPKPRPIASASAQG